VDPLQDRPVPAPNFHDRGRVLSGKYCLCVFDCLGDACAATHLLPNMFRNLRVPDGIDLLTPAAVFKFNYAWLTYRL
jgi:hypothetical protein